MQPIVENETRKTFKFVKKNSRDQIWQPFLLVHPLLAAKVPSNHLHKPFCQKLTGNLIRADRFRVVPPGADVWCHEPTDYLETYFREIAMLGPSLMFSW